MNWTISLLLRKGDGCTFCFLRNPNSGWKCSSSIFRHQTFIDEHWVIPIRALGWWALPSMSTDGFPSGHWVRESGLVGETGNNAGLQFQIATQCAEIPEDLTKGLWGSASYYPQWANSWPPDYTQPSWLEANNRSVFHHEFILSLLPHPSIENSQDSSIIRWWRWQRQRQQPLCVHTAALSLTDIVKPFAPGIYWDHVYENLFLNWRCST